MAKLIRPRSLLAVSVALVSFPVYLGGVIGYFAGKFYTDNIYGRRICKFLTLKSIFLPLGRYKLHLHHWLYSLFILTGAIFYDISFLHSQFVVGFFAGLALQDLVCDKDWYKILKRKT